MDVNGNAKGQLDRSALVAQCQAPHTASEVSQLQVTVTISMERANKPTSLSHELSYSYYYTEHFIPISQHRVPEVTSASVS